MRITKVQLKNFKRFTELNIENIPIDTKLVLLIGSNGSGKSSIFDAFNYLARRANGYTLEQEYIGKNNIELSVIIDFADADYVSIEPDHKFKGNRDKGKKLIGRSSIRIVPKISNTSDLKTLLELNFT